MPFRILMLLLLGAFAGCGGTDPSTTDNSGGGDKPKEEPTVQFAEIAKDSGVEFTFYNGRAGDQSTILESLGGGAGALDFDLDGFYDLCYPGGGKIPKEGKIEELPTGLFRNLGAMKFEAVAGEAGIEKSRHYTHGACVGDYNSDGFPDVLITGYGGLQLWRNQGDGSFKEVQDEAGLSDKGWSSSAAWGDLNGDGLLDLYVAHYVDWSWKNHPECDGPEEGQREICPPRKYSGVRDIVYFNNGDGTFRDATNDVALRDDAGSKGLGVMICDVNNDGHVDIYVANDTTDNYLYLGDGKGNFKEKGLLLGAAQDNDGIPNGSMGLDLCDYNRDGLFDIWVANYEKESFALYKNDGAGFYHSSDSTGISALGGLFVGFGTVAFDANLDGFEDFAVANGHVIKYPTVTERRQLPLVMLGNGKRFARQNYSKGYFATTQEGRGLTVSDLDNDGDLDLSASHMNDPVAILRNDTKTDGSWVALRLIGTHSNRDAIGARIELQTSSGTQTRQIKGGASYLSSLDQRVFFGIEKDTTIETATIHWPSGEVQTIEVALNELAQVVEVSQK